MRQQPPLFNLYFIFTVWTLILQGLAASLYGLGLPIGELLFSLTLAATAWRYGRRSLLMFTSCCYGILTGLLIYLIFFGLPFPSAQQL